MEGQILSHYHVLQRLGGGGMGVVFKAEDTRLDSRSMIVVQFAAPGQPVAADAWSMRVRGTWPNRRDRLPDVSPFGSKTLREGRGGKARIRAKSSKAQYVVPWGRHESLWIADVQSTKHLEQQSVDLKAQLALFLLQTALVPSDGALRDELVGYLRRTFRWRGVEDPDTAVYDVYGHLQTHKWWSDDWRAWRKLVRACINGVIKKRGHRAAIRPDLTPDADGCLTVDQFAISCRMSRSKAYDLIRAGSICVMRRKTDGRTIIPLSEVKRISRKVRRRDVLAMAVQRRGSLSAARKWVYRKERAGKTLAEIATLVSTDLVTRRAVDTP